MNRLDEFGHADYPHQWGWLFDCPGCEAQCFCEPHDVGDGEECVHCYLVLQEA